MVSIERGELDFLIVCRRQKPRDVPRLHLNWSQGWHVRRHFLDDLTILSCAEVHLLTALVIEGHVRAGGVHIERSELD